MIFSHHGYYCWRAFFSVSLSFSCKYVLCDRGTLCLLAIVTLLFIPNEINIFGHFIDVWWTLIGFGSMSILWITSLVMLFTGRKILHIARRQHEH